MADPSQFIFSYQEVVEALIKHNGLHEGIWALSINFGLSATNVGSSDNDLKPAAFLAVLNIGIQKQEKETNISANAAKVNPRPKSPPANLPSGKR